MKVRDAGLCETGTVGHECSSGSCPQVVRQNLILKLCVTATAGLVPVTTRVLQVVIGLGGPQYRKLT